MISRRARSIAGLAALALVATPLLPMILVVLAAADVVRGRRRLPLARLAVFGVCWAWLELAGVTAAGWLWLTGRVRSADAHYRLQAWWADRLMAALQATCGLRFEFQGEDLLGPGPTVLLSRHVSLADALLTNWAVMRAGLRPRVVMKRELLVDPCLDIVGNRLPNCFVDRSATDSAPELAAIGAMANGLGVGDVGVIFPEGTRANPDKAARAMQKLTETDPHRAARLAPLRHLLPPRPAGSSALLQSAAGADVVIGWHTGLEGLDDFHGILDAIADGRTLVRLHFARLSMGDIPVANDEFTRWLDDTWLRLDDEVDRLLDTPTA